MSSSKIDDKIEHGGNKISQTDWNVARLYGWSCSRCGYCDGNRAQYLKRDGKSVHEDDSSKAYGITFSHVSATDYQALIDSGWRRSGKHLYKPDNWNSCCAAIPIRLNTNEFQPSKSQKKVWKTILNLQKHIEKERIVHTSSHQETPQIRKKARRMGGISNLSSTETCHGGPKKHPPFENVITTLRNSIILKELQQSTYNILQVQLKDIIADDVLKVAKDLCSFKIRTSHFSLLTPEVTNSTDEGANVRGSLNEQNHKSVECCLFTTVCAAVAGRSKQNIDRDLLATTIANKLNDTFLLKNGNAEEFILAIRQVTSHKKSGQINVYLQLSMDMIEEKSNRAEFIEKCNQFARRPKSTQKRLKKSFDNDKQNEADTLLTQLLQTNATFEEENNDIFTVRSVPSHHSAVDPEVQRLFFNYQNVVHGDENPFQGTSLDGKENIALIQKKIKSFKRFLCASPLAIVAGKFDVDEEGYDTLIPYGSYHQQYRINKRLVAVGVVDILPNSLSSVYSFYDPILSKKLNLGTLTALREIEWVKRASASRPNLKYYYLGYYIHSCGKMRYKADFKPSKLLCPKYGEWVDFEAAKAVIERDSPVRHCCALTFNPKYQKKVTKKPSIESMQLDITVRESHKKTNASDNLDDDDNGDDDSVINEDNDEDGLGDVNMSTLITVGDLNSYGRKVVNPYVEEFVSVVGMDISQRSIIRI